MAPYVQYYVVRFCLKYGQKTEEIAMRPTLLFVVILISGCVTNVDPTVYRASRDAKVSGRNVATAGNELTIAYIDRERTLLQEGGAVSDPLGPMGAKYGATVILRNNDRARVHVVIQEANSMPEIADTWDLVIEEGETFTYPLDDHDAPRFKMNASYKVKWWRERSGTGYSQTPRYYERIMKTGVKPRWSSKEQIHYFGGLEFLPGPAYE